MSCTPLRPLLAKHSLALRRNRFSFRSLDEPQSVKVDEVLTSEGWRRRCRVVLTAHGCQVGTCTMCPLPDEAVGFGTEVTTQNWVRQLEAAREQASSCDMLTLFHNGNFFHDREVPPERRQAVYEWVRARGFRTLVVESLPQFITDARLDDAWRHLGEDVTLEVAIGLQTTDAFLRETVLASTCTYDGFVRARQALRARGFGEQVFLMHQMPFLSAEESSVALLHTLTQLWEQHGIVEATVGALYLAPGTVAWRLHELGMLELAGLWHLADALVLVRRELPSSRLRVAASCLADWNGEKRAGACPGCRDALLQWVSDFNFQREGPLPSRCSCAPAPLDAQRGYERAVVEERIRAYLGSQAAT